jgi:hypothetical protein
VDVTHTGTSLLSESGSGASALLYMPISHIVQSPSKATPHSPSIAGDVFLEVVMRVKARVGRNTIVIKIVTRVWVCNLHGIDDQTVVQAHAQLNVLADGVVPVERLETHVVWRAVRPTSETVEVSMT